MGYDGFVRATGGLYTQEEGMRLFELWQANGQVERHERASAFVYTFITKLRADYAPAAPSHIFGATAPVVLRAMRLARAHNGSRIFVQPWYGHRCYGQLDWFFVAARDAAAVLLRVSEAPCEWRSCLRERYADLGRPQPDPTLRQYNKVSSARAHANP